MFTGLIEELGTVMGKTEGGRSSKLTIKASKVLEGVQIGDSISTNGVCLTVTHFTKEQFTVDVMPETMMRSNLKDVKAGTSVNLERALRLGDRLGGHMVSGHIDGQGTITSIAKDENAYWFQISASPSILKYIIEKGSVALDGISLTVAAVDFESFKVSIIPHTLKKTSLDKRKVGDAINIECDAFGKYVERIAAFATIEDTGVGASQVTNKSSKLDLNFLSEHGFR